MFGFILFSHIYPFHWRNAFIAVFDVVVCVLCTQFFQYLKNCYDLLSCTMQQQHIIFDCWSVWRFCLFEKIITFILARQYFVSFYLLASLHRVITLLLLYIHSSRTMNAKFCDTKIHNLQKQRNWLPVLLLFVVGLGMCHDH